MISLLLFLLFGEGVIDTRRSTQLVEMPAFAHIVEALEVEIRCPAPAFLIDFQREARTEDMLCFAGFLLRLLGHRIQTFVFVLSQIGGCYILHWFSLINIIPIIVPIFQTIDVIIYFFFLALVFTFPSFGSLRSPPLPKEIPFSRMLWKSSSPTFILMME